MGFFLGVNSISIVIYNAFSIFSPICRQCTLLSHLILAFVTLSKLFCSGNDDYCATKLQCVASVLLKASIQTVLFSGDWKHNSGTAAAPLTQPHLNGAYDIFHKWAQDLCCAPSP